MLNLAGKLGRIRSHVRRQMILAGAKVTSAGQLRHNAVGSRLGHTDVVVDEFDLGQCERIVDAHEDGRLHHNVY